MASVGKCESSHFVLFFLKMVWAILGPPNFYVNLRISFPMSAKHQQELQRDRIESIYQLGSHFDRAKFETRDVFPFV